MNKRSAQAIAKQQARLMEADPHFVTVWRHRSIGGLSPHCGLWTKAGEDVPALCAGTDILGNWTVVTLQGYVKQYLADEVA